MSYHPIWAWFAAVTFRPATSEVCLRATVPLEITVRVRALDVWFVRPQALAVESARQGPATSRGSRVVMVE